MKCLLCVRNELDLFVDIMIIKIQSVSLRDRVDIMIGISKQVYKYL